MNAKTRQHIKGTTDERKSFNSLSSDDGRKLLNHLDIPREVIPELSYRRSPVDNDLIQFNYYNNIVPSEQASAYRGKIVDVRTGKPVCGGSTYTHLAIAPNDELEIDEDNNIILRIVDDNLSPTGQIIKMPIPSNEFARRARFLKKKLDELDQKVLAAGGDIEWISNSEAGSINQELLDDAIAELRELKKEQESTKKLYDIAMIESDGSMAPNYGSSPVNDATGGTNLVHDVDVITGTQSFFRMYSEGAHLYIFKHNGTVYFATHNNPAAGYWRDGQLVAKGRFGGLNFRTFVQSYLDIGGPHPDRLFPDPAVLTSPYVYRFLVCTPERVINSRLIINSNGYLVFIGVHKMWEYGPSCPYRTDINEVSGKPFAGTRDDRTPTELLDLNNMIDTSKIVVVSSLDDVLIDEMPVIYYPRSSFSVEECNSLLRLGLDAGNLFDARSEGWDPRLGLGESLMLTKYYNVDGVNYIVNVRLMSSSYAYRMSCHNGKEWDILKDMNDFVEKSLEPGAFFTDHKYLNFHPFLHREVYQEFIVPCNDALEIGDYYDMYYPRPPNEIYDIRGTNNFFRRMVAANLYIYTVNPKQQMYLILFVYNLHMRIIGSICRIVFARRYINVKPLLDEQEIVQKFIVLCEQVTMVAEELNIDFDNEEQYNTIVYETILNNFSLVDIENIARYCELDWETLGADAMNDLKIINATLSDHQNRNFNSLERMRQRMETQRKRRNDSKQYKRGDGKKLKQKLQFKYNQKQQGRSRK